MEFIKSQLIKLLIPRPHFLPGTLPALVIQIPKNDRFYCFFMVFCQPQKKKKTPNQCGHVSSLIPSIAYWICKDWIFLGFFVVFFITKQSI